MIFVQIDGSFFSRPNNAPPAYPQNPPQPGFQPSGVAYNGQTAAFQSQSAFAMQGRRPVWGNVILTPMTSNLRGFCIISGILCLLCGITNIGLEIGILMNSYTTYYGGLWGGSYLIGTGIVMLIAACRPMFNMNAVIRTSAIALVLVIIGVILSILSVITVDGCRSYYYINCDQSLVNSLEIARLAIFCLSVVQVIANIVVASAAQKSSIVARNPNVAGF